jgi:hypothetical protein
MVVGFTTSYAIGAYHHWCYEFEFCSGRGVQHYVIKFVSDLRQVLSMIRFNLNQKEYKVKVINTLYRNEAWQFDGFRFGFMVFVKICLWLWKYKGQPTFTSFYFSNHKLFRHAKYAAIWSYRTWQCIMCKILLREH